MSTSDTFPYLYRVDVIFRDIDAMGHVNNAVYLTYMETARIRYLSELLGLAGLEGLPFILAEITCSYRTPAFYGEQLHVGLGISRLGTKSFDIAYRIETDGGRLVTTGRSTLVMYDYAAGQTIALSDEFRERVRTYQGDWEPPING
jgi:acyl-CoA thioester hydrolase